MGPDPEALQTAPAGPAPGMPPPATAADRRLPPYRNLANQLTASRFVLAVLLFILIALDCWLGCLVVFVVAAVTDWLDGYLARHYGLASAIGRNLDPLADKVLTCGAFIFLLPRGIEGRWLVPWMVTVVVARELVITGLRSFLESQGAAFGADWLGKIKMGLQCAALIAIFVALEVSYRQAETSWFFDQVRSGLIYAMLAATALSGLQYVWKAGQLLKTVEG